MGMKIKSNQNGFAAVETVLVVIILGIVGFTGWFVLHSQKATDKTLANTGNSSAPSQKNSTPTTASKQDSNKGYRVVKEWGLRFKIPSGLTDVGYIVAGDTASFYGKPIGSDVQYSTPQRTVADLFRSTDSTKDKLDTTVQGKKVGSYYYYTGWSFSGLATGAGCEGLFTNDPQVGDGPSCPAENTVFHLINGTGSDKGMLGTIELAE